MLRQFLYSKRLWVFAIVLMAIGGVTTGWAHESGVKVVVNESPVTFPEGADAYLDQGHTMIPLRAVGEALGANVFWFEDQKQVQLTKYDKVLLLALGDPLMSEYAIVNGVTTFVKDWNLPVPAVQHGMDRSYCVYVPLRAIVEAMDAYVEWNDGQQTAYVHSYKDMRWYNVMKIPEIARSGHAVLFQTTGQIVMLEGIPYLWDGENLGQKIQITNTGSEVWQDLFGGQDFSAAQVEISGVTELGDSGEVIVPFKRSTTTLKLLESPIYTRTGSPVLSAAAVTVSGELLNISFVYGYQNPAGEPEFQVRRDMIYRYQYIFENEDMGTMTVSANKIFGTVGCNLSALNAEFQTARVKAYAQIEDGIISEPTVMEWRVKRLEEQRQIVVEMPDGQMRIIEY